MAGSVVEDDDDEDVDLDELVERDTVLEVASSMTSCWVRTLAGGVNDESLADRSNLVSVTTFPSPSSE